MDFLYTARGNAKWYSYFGKCVWWFLINLLYDPAIPLLSIYKRNENTYSHKDDLHLSAHNSFIHNSPNWKPPKCPSPSEC